MAQTVPLRSRAVGGRTRADSIVSATDRPGRAAARVASSRRRPACDARAHHTRLSRPPVTASPSLTDRPATVSIVVPTYNERARLGELVAAVFAVFSRHAIDGELVIVDDHSPDGTGALADELATRYRIRVLHRRGKLGLGTAVLDGFRDGQWRRARRHGCRPEPSARRPAAPAALARRRAGGSGDCLALHAAAARRATGRWCGD